MNEAGREEILMLCNYFTYVTPLSYGNKEDGSLAALNDQLVLDAVFLTGTTPLLVRTNFKNGKFSSDLVAKIGRASCRDRAVDLESAEITVGKGVRYQKGDRSFDRQ